MSTPTWIWTDANGDRRNDFALFRRVIDVPAAPSHAVLHLFVDSRYRLRLDGELVAYGPIRFDTSHPEYDSIDLGERLTPGRHLLVVEAWTPNAYNYQINKESRGGFIAWGEIRWAGGSLDLATPDGWEAQRPTAWEADAPCYSFAQGPVEVLDYARLPEALFTEAGQPGWGAASARASGPWGALHPRSVGAYQHRLAQPAVLSLVAALDDGERRTCVRVFTPDFGARRAAAKERLRAAYALTITSPRDQEVTLGLFWGPNFCNGAPLTMSNDPAREGRELATARLKRGENLLYGEPEILGEVWMYYVALPRAANLVAGPLRVTAAMPESRMPSATRAPGTTAELDALGLAWSGQERAGGAKPAKDCAWDTVGRTIARGAAAEFPLTLSGPAPAGWVVVADFGFEYGGHVAVDLEAPAGTVVDVATDERLRDDGMVKFYQPNCFIDNCERYVWAGGRRLSEAFHPRGGRWVQLCIRPPAGFAGSVVLHRLGVRDHQVAVARDGTFACADQLFGWAWELCYNTIQANVEDCILADSWRERAVYASDILCQAPAFMAYSRDLALAKRTSRLYTEARRANGLLVGTPAAWGGNDGALVSSMHWLELCHLIWSRDGDLAHAAESWPIIEQILATDLPSTIDGLWDAPGWIFMDWGATQDGDANGQGNAVLNMWRYRALCDGADLARALGRTEAAARFTERAQAVRQAIQSRLWDGAARRFARRLVDGRPDPAGAAMHANALALAYDVASPEQAPGCADALARTLADNVERNRLRGKGHNEPGKGAHDGTLEIFFLHFAMVGLWRRGYAAIAERALRDHHAPMYSSRAWVLWENLKEGEEQQANLCQSWGATFAVCAHDHILGVRPEVPGDPLRMLVAPDSTLEWAEGAVPHPRGSVWVSWRRIGDRLRVRVRAPDGVRVRILAGHAFAGLTLDASVEGGLGASLDQAPPQAPRVARARA